MLDKPEIAPAILEAADKIEAWLKAGSPTPGRLFKVTGYAGSGKTTLIKRLVEQLGESKVYCASYSGKAAYVMRSKGIDSATTIHSLIYHPEDPPADEVESLQRRINQASKVPENQALLKKLRAELRELVQPTFKLNKSSKLSGARLLILDEVSMVGKGLAEDVLSFKRPTLVVGDPGQLPPVEGTGYFDKMPANVELTELHRQEVGSPIIEYATDIRNGRRMRKYARRGVFGSTAAKLGPEGMYQWFERADQVICGLNHNRRKYNVGMLKRAGFEGIYPTGRDEKLICLKNDHRRGLVNGMPVALTDVRDEGHTKYFYARVWVEDDRGALKEDRGEVRVYKGYFETAVDGNENRILQDLNFRQQHRLVELDWGYCITCHKAQGSEWASVVVFDDGWGTRGKGGEKRHRRWLYTAVTRASREVAVVRA
jgi:exodeoxyribonuclease-5